MSEVKLNLIDSEHVLHGTIHGSIADRCVAALSAEPETIGELASALSRYNKRLDDWSPFASFHSSVHSSTASSADPPIDCSAWDAGIVVIDLTARIVAADSTYSQPQPEGEIHYHDGTKCTDIPVLYRLPDDWLFVNSVEAYQWSRERRAKERLAKAPFDARHVLYGTPLLEFLVNALGTSVEAGLVIPAMQASASHQTGTDTFVPTVVRNFAVTDDDSRIEDDCRVGDKLLGNGNGSSAGDYEAQLALATALSAIHARWLMTPREDLRGDSPRAVMLARQDFIDFDLHTRSLQWSLLDEGPPCLAPDSFAYRFAGFGTHEWIIYYDLVRYLLWSAAADKQLWSAVTCHPFGRSDVSTAVACAEPLLTPLASDETLNRQHSPLSPQLRAMLLARLEHLKSDWLEQPNSEYDDRTPCILIDNERKRLPIALRPRDMIIDDDCPICQMFGDETSPLGMGVGFWHLDGCNMDDDFAFSSYKTRAEWEAENRRQEEFNQEFDRRSKERQERSARGEPLEPDPWFDPDPFPEWEFPDSSSVPDEKAN